MKKAITTFLVTIGIITIFVGVITLVPTPKRHVQHKCGCCRCEDCGCRQRCDEATEATKWRTDIAEAQQEAAKVGKKVLIYIQSRTCPGCRELEHTLADESVQKAIEAAYIPVKLDGGSQQARQLRVQAYPALISKSPDGQVNWTKYGSRNATTLISELK